MFPAWMPKWHLQLVQQIFSFAKCERRFSLTSAAPCCHHLRLMAKRIKKDRQGSKPKAYQSQTCIHEHTWSYMIIHGQLQRQLKTATTLTSSDRSHPFPIWTSRFAKAQLLAPVVALALARREASPAPKAPDSTVMFRSSGTRRMNGQDLSPMVTPDVSPSHMPVVILFSIVLISIEILTVMSS